MGEMTVTVYTFEGEDGPVGVFTTQDYQEAKDHARAYSLAVIANEYEWADSEIVDDFRTVNA